MSCFSAIMDAYKLKKGDLFFMLAYFLAFLGGIALFMYGMQLMGDGLQKAAGAKLQKIWKP